MKTICHIKIAFIFFMLSLSLKAQAWQELRNGGDVMICSRWDDYYTGWQTSIEMMDYYEMKVRYGLKYAPTENALEEYQVHLETVQEYLSRIPDSQSALRAQAQPLALSFYSEAKFVEAKLYDAKDAGTRISGPNCRIEQLVLQAPPMGSEDAYYVINNMIWNEMDTTQQSVAILHEILYRLAPNDKKQYSSEKIRYIVALIISDSLKNKSPEDLHKLFQGFDF